MATSDVLTGFEHHIPLREAWHGTQIHGRARKYFAKNDLNYPI
jgi:hypothetical protein